jgi:hypothetical protein
MFGVSTTAECIAVATERLPTQPQLDCVRMVIADHAAEVMPIMDCQHDAVAVYGECVLAAVSASCLPEPTEVMSCVDRQNEDLVACGEPSPAVRAEVMRCYGS